MPEEGLVVDLGRHRGLDWESDQKFDSSYASSGEGSGNDVVGTSSPYGRVKTTADPSIATPSLIAGRGIDHRNI